MSDILQQAARGAPLPDPNSPRPPLLLEGSLCVWTVDCTPLVLRPLLAAEVYI